MIPCPDCGSTSSRVTLTRHLPCSIRRRRLCRDCGHGYETREVAPPESRLALIRRLRDSGLEWRDVAKHVGVSAARACTIYTDHQDRRRASVAR